MKPFVISLIVLFLFFGCIEITEKQQEEDEEDDDTNQGQDPFEELIEDLEEDLNQLEEVVEEEPEEEPVEEEPVDEPPDIPLPPPPVSTASAEILFNTDTIELAEGEFLEVDGTQDYSGTKLKISLERVLSTGVEFVGKFKIEKSDGTVLDRRNFTAGTELIFIDPEGETITFDALLELQNLYLD